MKTNNNKKTKLNWKLKWCDDKSGCWYSAKVPVLGWEYIIDVGGFYDYEIEEFVDSKEYEPRIFYSKFDDDCTHFGGKSIYAKLNSAKAACEKHLTKTVEKLKKMTKN